MKTSIANIMIPPGRARKDFSGVQALIDSLNKNGMLHPIVVTTDPAYPDKFILVAGGRRFQAAIMAGWKEIPYTLFDSLSAEQQKEAELEENVQRKDYHWMEEAENRRQLYLLKQKQNPAGKNQQAVADAAGVSQPEVSTSIAIAQKLIDRPELVERVSHLPRPAAQRMIERIEEAEKYSRLEASGSVIASMDLRLGDCRTLIKALPTASIDLLLTDPPFGIAEIEKLRSSPSEKYMTSMGTTNATQNLSHIEILQVLKDLAPELARVMKPGAHFYMFCGGQYCGAFVDAISPHLEFHAPVLVWDKGKTTTPGTGYNWLSQCEWIIYGCKPPQQIRLADNKSNLIRCPDIPRGARTYSFEKPTALLKQLIEMSSHINQTILDPFAGSASTLIAAKQSGRKAIGFEIDQEAWARAQNRLREEAKGVKE